MAHDGLNALLVDVGGTLVDDATWLDRAEYERLMVARLRDAFRTDLPWFAPLASHPFAESDAAPWEQRTAETVMSFLSGQGVEVSAAEVERICRACALPLKPSRRHGRRSERGSTSHPGSGRADGGLHQLAVAQQRGRAA